MKDTIIIRREQSGLEIHSGGKTLAIDIGTLTPAETVKAMVAPDAILVSHKHADHLGLDHLKILGAPIVAPGDVVELLHDGANATAIRAGQTLDVAGFTVTAIEADHGPKLSAPIENIGFGRRLEDGLGTGPGFCLQSDVRIGKGAGDIVREAELAFADHDDLARSQFGIAHDLPVVEQCAVPAAQIPHQNRIGPAGQPAVPAADVVGGQADLAVFVTADENFRFRQHKFPASVFSGLNDEIGHAGGRNLVSGQGRTGWPVRTGIGRNSLHCEDRIQPVESRPSRAAVLSLEFPNTGADAAREQSG